jgi:type IV pilus assembly protein PilO
MDLKDPKKQKIILSFVLAAALLYAYFVYDYSPKAREINLREVHLVGLKQHIKNARARIERSDEAKLRNELRSLERELERLEQLLPLEEEVPYLLSEVERRGLQSGVSSVLFEPRGTFPSHLYTEYVYRVSVRGGYHSIGLFLSLVSNMRRIISPAKLNLILRQQGREAQKMVEDEIFDVVAEFDMRTYITEQTPPAAVEIEERAE